MKRIAVFLIVGVVFLGACSKQNAIIGTWIDDGGDGWVFGTNGKLSFTNDDDNFPYVVSDDELTINFPNGSLVVYKIQIDGKTMVLNVSSKNGSTPSWVRNYSFTKK